MRIGRLRGVDEEENVKKAGNGIYISTVFTSQMGVMNEGRE